jgi:hypothetical protein
MGALIAVVNKKGEDATNTAVTMLSALSSATTDAFAIASPLRAKSERSIDSLRQLCLDSNIIIGYRYPAYLQSDRQQPIMLKRAAMIFEGRIYYTNRIFKIEPFAIDLQEHGKEAARRFVNKIFGDYAFVLAEPGGVIAGELYPGAGGGAWPCHGGWPVHPRGEGGGPGAGPAFGLGVASFDPDCGLFLVYRGGAPFLGLAEDGEALNL